MKSVRPRIPTHLQHQIFPSFIQGASLDALHSLCAAACSALDTIITMSPIPAADLQSFSEHLQKSTRILALLGAGLSASSGLPTFRGAGGIWRNFDATLLATPKAFSDNPGLVWQFYGYRRHMALDAKPNRAHYALAELARRNQNFITLSQNVDGRSSLNPIECSSVQSSTASGRCTIR